MHRLAHPIVIAFEPSIYMLYVLHICVNIVSLIYYTGSRIVCTTSEASEGGHLVSVSVRRGSQMARPRSLPTFTFAHPIINSVEPQQGPKAGGTYIVFQGSNLDISSDGVAKVFIGEVPCDIQ